MVGPKSVWICCTHEFKAVHAFLFHNRTIGDRNYTAHHSLANHWPTNKANHEPTIMVNVNKTSEAKCNQENGIRIFDPMLFEDIIVNKIMEDFNTKCFFMNNIEKLFQ